MAEIEEVFEAWPQELHDHDRVVALRAVILDAWDADCGRRAFTLKLGDCRSAIKANWAEDLISQPASGEGKFEF